MANKLFDTPDTTRQFDPQDIELNNRLSLLSYLGVLVLVPLFCVKYSRYARYHANQGLVLFLVNLASGIVLSAIKLVLGLIATGVSALFVQVASSSGAAFLMTVGSVLAGAFNVFVWILSIAVSVTLLFLTVVGILYAVKGRAKELPLIGRIHLLK